MKNTVSITAVGDIMLGDSPVLFGHGVRSQAQKHGLESIFRHVRPYLQDADITFGNLESVLSEAGAKYRTLHTLEYRGKPEFAEILSAVGFNIVSFANNHCFQYGPHAFRETTEVLQANRIDCVGLREPHGESNVVRIDKNGLQLAVIGYSLRPEKYGQNGIPYAQGPDFLIVDQVNRLAREGNSVIVSLHWGEEYIRQPSCRQVRLAHKLVDAGAALILGHHPHVLQGFEWYNGSLIAYSLGNFVFDKWQLNQRETVLLNCEVGSSGIVAHHILPILIRKDYRPTPARGKQGKKIIRKVNGYNARLHPARSEKRFCDAEKYEKMAEKAYFLFRIRSYLYFVRNFYRYEPWVIKDSAVRFVHRRFERDTASESG